MHNSVLYVNDGVSDMFNNNPSSVSLDYFYYIDVEISNRKKGVSASTLTSSSPSFSSSSSSFDKLVGEWEHFKTISTVTQVSNLGSFEIELFTSVVFPTQYMMIMYIKNGTYNIKNGDAEGDDGDISMADNFVSGRDYSYVGHGQFTYDSKDIYYLSFTILNALSNTYYKMDMYFILLSMFNVTDGQFRMYLDTTFRTKIQLKLVKLDTSLSTLSGDSDWNSIFDSVVDHVAAQSSEIEVIPVPVSFQIFITPEQNNIIKFQYKLFSLSWSSIKRWVVCISFVYTPMFMYYSEDSVACMLNGDNKMYHKYSPLIKYYEITEEDIANITATNNVYICTSSIVNYFKNIPVSMIITIVSVPVFQSCGGDVSQVVTKHPDECYHLHQIMPSAPSIIPRYLFLDDMPPVKTVVFRYTPADILIKIEHDKINSFPYTGKLTLDDVPSMVRIEVDFTESTEYILIHLPHKMIIPALINRNIRIDYSIRYSICKNIEKTHFVVYPIDDLVGGRNTLELTMKDFSESCSSLPLDSNIPWFVVHSPNCPSFYKGMVSRNKNIKCYRYKSRKCKYCGCFAHVNKKDIHKYIIKEATCLSDSDAGTGSSPSLKQGSDLGKYSIELIHAACKKTSMSQHVQSEDNGKKYTYAFYDVIETGVVGNVDTGFSQLFKRTSI